MTFDALKADLYRLSAIRELNPDEKAALSYLEAPNGGEPPQVVRALERERQILQQSGLPLPLRQAPKAELIALRARLRPYGAAPEEPAEPWSLWPLEDFKECSLQDLWDKIEILEKDYKVKAPRGIEHFDHAGLKGWLLTVIQTPEIREQWLQKEHEKLLRSFYHLNKNGSVIPNNEAIAAWLDTQMNLLSWNGDLYVYHDGIYTLNKGEVEAKIQAVLNEIGFVGRIVTQTREIVHRLTYLHPEMTYPFNRQRDLIPVKNGVLCVDYDGGAVTLLDHSPEYRFTYKLPVAYNPTASSAFILSVLRSWVAPEDVVLLLQYPAQALLQAQSMGVYKKAYILEGERDAGKTTYYNLIREGFFGPENMSKVDLTAICKDKFALAPMENKLSNFKDDLDNFPLSYIGTFKEITGDVWHRIERKGKDSYDGFIFAVQVFTCNKPPKCKDTSDDAFWRRWEYVIFPNKFPVDPSFKERLHTAENLSALLNEVLKVMVTIVRQKRLIRDSSPDEIKDRWVNATDSLFAFTKEHTEKADGAFIPTDDFYAGYCADCQRQGKVPEGKNRVTVLLEPMGIFVKQKRIGKDRPRVYEGVRWKEESPYCHRSPGGAHATLV